MSEKKPGIYCIEGVPEHSEGEISARPMLEMLAQAHGFRFVHRIAVTRPEFLHHFIKWAGREGWDYPILYLWYHGYPKGISLNVEQNTHLTSIRFEDIIDALDALEWNLEHCIIHFGACYTLAEDDDRVHDFLKNTSLVAISGYKGEIGWIEGAAVELLYLNCLYDIFGENKNRKYLRQPIMKDCRNRLWKKSPSKDLVEHLKFDICVRRSK